MVSNPDFDVDVAGWNPVVPAISIAHDPLQNAVGASGSGAARVTNSTPNLNAYAYQCVGGVTPGASYDFGAWVRKASGQAGQLQAAYVLVSFFDTANCGGVSSGFVQSPTLVFDDTWTLLTSSAIAPASAASASLDLAVYNALNSPGPVDVDFDGARFGLVPTSPVALQAFTVE